MSPLVVPSRSAVEKFTIEFIRNRLAARAAPSVLLPPPEAAPWLHEWWQQREHAPGKLIIASESTAASSVDLVIASSGEVMSAGARECAFVKCDEALLLPGAT